DASRDRSTDYPLRMPSDAPSVTRSDVARALAALDRGEIAAARWFGAKGRSIATIELEEAVVLDDAAPHVLAIAALALDDGERQRYSVALTGTPLREARPGDGAWRSLAVAMADGQALPALTAEPTSDAQPAPTAVLVCRPGAAMP